MEKVNTVVNESATKQAMQTAKQKKNTRPSKTIEDLKPSDRVSVDNLRAWELSFIPRNGNVEQVTKGIIINPNVRNYKFLLSEIEDQVNSGEELFCGVDGLGAHAALRIIDPVVREYVFGEPVDPVQLTEDAVIELLAMEDKKSFEKRLQELVVTDSEKRMIIVMCSNRTMFPRINIDDVPSYKFTAIERLTGIKID